MKRDTERQRHREIYRDIDFDRDTDIKRDTERQRHRDRDREAERASRYVRKVWPFEPRDEAPCRESGSRLSVREPVRGSIRGTGVREPALSSALSSVAFWLAVPTSPPRPRMQGRPWDCHI